MMKPFLLLLCMHIIVRADGQITNGEPRQIDTIRDREGNIYSVKKMADNKLWMTDNLKINIPGSYCYGDIKQNCEQYGRLYTWESATKVCSMLGVDWRLPTDNEWQEMAKQYGGVYQDSAQDGKSVYKALLSGGSSALNIILGGGRDQLGKYGRVDAHGFYWTATESDSTMAWFYNFGKGSGKLYRQKDGEKPRAFSVRCMKDVAR